MKVLVDINVLLDVVLERHPWHSAAAQVLSRIDEGGIQGSVAGHTLPTVHYIVAKARNRETAAAAITDLLRIVDVVPVEKEDFHQALILPVDDFEDAVQLAAALKIGADYVVTRNEKDFERGAISPIRADRLLSLLSSSP